MSITSLKSYRKSRMLLALLSATSGAGVGYEIGWGWGAVVTSGLLSAYFLIVAFARDQVEEVGRKQGFEDAHKRMIKVVRGVSGSIIDKDELIAILTEKAGEKS